jgi:hypothetical protein
VGDAGRSEAGAGQEETSAPSVQDSVDAASESQADAAESPAPIDRCGSGWDAGPLAQDGSFVVDVDTISIEVPNGPIFDFALYPLADAERYPWLDTPDCGAACTLGRASYLDYVFGRSDTAIAVLRGPAYGLGADGTGSNGFAAAAHEDLLDAQNVLEARLPGRSLLVSTIMPNDRLELQLLAMEQRARSVDAWASDTAWRPLLPQLTDHIRRV